MLPRGSVPEPTLFPGVAGGQAGRGPGRSGRDPVGVRHLAPLLPVSGRLWGPNDVKLVVSEGEQPLGWDVTSGDAFHSDPRAVVANVLRQTQPGSIIVMHLMGPPNAPATSRALVQILPRLRQRGFQFVTLSVLVDANPSGPPSSTPSRLRRHERATAIAGIAGSRAPQGRWGWRRIGLLVAIPATTAVLLGALWAVTRPQRSWPPSIGLTWQASGSLRCDWSSG